MRGARKVANTPDRAAVLAALDKVRDPRSGRGIVSAGLVQGLSLRESRAGFILEVAREDVGRYEPVRAEAEAALRRAARVETAQVVLTAQGPSGAGAPAASATGPSRAASAPAERAPAALPSNVRAVLAVASGKGGVGKSTVAVNLACAFAALGLRAGIADADVQGPSIPRLLGLDERPASTPEKKIVPLRAHGVQAISMGLLMKSEDALVWRGPMIASAVNTLVHETLWGAGGEPLDVLVVDLPPGTGDIQLTLSQKTALAGAVMVTTPQAVALDDVRRGAAMFGKVDVPILGVVENMSWFEAPDGSRTALFGEGGGQALADELGAPLLAQLPLEVAVREGGDAGRPVVIADPNGASAERLKALAEALRERL